MLQIRYGIKIDKLMVPTCTFLFVIFLIELCQFNSTRTQWSIARVISYYELFRVND